MVKYIISRMNALLDYGAVQGWQDHLAGRTGLFFSLGVFTSAALLFAIQPLFTKMALPLLGGASNVWNVAMVFFQATLLAGYIYAHLITRYTPVRFQPWIHLAIVAAGLSVLPFDLSDQAPPTVQNGSGIWLLGLLAAHVGLPFFALSATAPLLQRWYSLCGTQQADDPYFLYSASNMGSLLALAAYPFLIEPLMTVRDQSGFWMTGYTVSIALTGTTGLVMFLSNPTAQDMPSQPLRGRTGPVGGIQRLTWIGLSAAPVALMLAVTTNMTTNISPAPFLWLTPLILYLLTFIIAFSRRPAISVISARRLAPLAIITLAVSKFLLLGSSAEIGIAVSLIAFFFIALFCHSQLASQRPPVDHLTEYYLLMSLGGVIGGIFTAFAAPTLLNDVYELPIMLVLVSLLLPAARAKQAGASRWRHSAVIAAMISVAVGIPVLFFGLQPGAWFWAFFTSTLIFIAAAMFITYKARGEPVQFAAGIMSIVITLGVLEPLLSVRGASTVLVDRGFYGVSKVLRQDSRLGAYHMLVHGNTVHNNQLRGGDDETVPLAYYFPSGPFGEALDHFRGHSPRPLSVGSIGLGAGALACHKKAGEFWRFFEINPLVVSIARDERYFSYVSKCAPDDEIVIADGRIAMLHEQRSGTPKYDLIFVDAFSSDSVPAHLLTRESMDLFRQRLRDDGILFYHTSNSYMDITSVVITAARSLDLDWRVRRFLVPDRDGLNALAMNTMAVVVGKAPQLAALSAENPQWRREEPNEAVGLWTDDYTHILGAIYARMTSAQPAGRTGH